MSQPKFGEPVRVRFRKWDGSPHWQTTTNYLGSDEHGHWLGNHPGIEVSRPGASYRSTATTVQLITHDGCFLANFTKPPSRIVSYTDITTTPEFGRDGTGWLLGAVDMDLDVVRTDDGRTWIDDEDEFAEHIVSYGYPTDLIANTRATADTVLAAVREGSEPFGSSWRGWIDRLADIT